MWVYFNHDGSHFNKYGHKRSNFFSPPKKKQVKKKRRFGKTVKCLMKAKVKKIVSKSRLIEGNIKYLVDILADLLFLIRLPLSLGSVRGFVL